MMLPSNSMIGVISEALALAETPKTLTRARAAAETAETAFFAIMRKDRLVI
jgi:hypothetical protein